MAGPPQWGPQEQGGQVAGIGEKDKRERIHEGHIADPEFLTTCRVNVVIPPEGKASMGGTVFGQKYQTVSNHHKAYGALQTKLQDTGHQISCHEDEDIWSEQHGTEEKGQEMGFHCGPLYEA